MSTTNTRTFLNQLKLCELLHVIQLCETVTSADEVCTTLRISSALMSKIMETRNQYENSDTTSVSRKNMTLGDKIRVLH